MVDATLRYGLAQVSSLQFLAPRDALLLVHGCRYAIH
jgi:hypothetical protein